MLIICVIFSVSKDIADLTKTDLFSTVGGEKGSSDAERDPRGFAVKFYTKEGNWDVAGANTPVFFCA